ncbi:MAG: nucleotidyl transferase AbiEii/AbiGii toxin family protein [Pseudonocardiaceae bacterium]
MSSLRSASAGRDYGAGPAVGSDRCGAGAGGIAGAVPAVLRCATSAAAGTTAASFAAWKMIAWLDRSAARDLYDLWALAQIGAIDELAVDLFVRYGPTGRPPSVHRFEHPPDEIRCVVE